MLLLPGDTPTCLNHFAPRFTRRTWHHVPALVVVLVPCSSVAKASDSTPSAGRGAKSVSERWRNTFLQYTF